MSIFISYARKDRTAAETLRHDLERARSEVWLDDELTGGQAWWETILGQIRSCELFVFALSPDSLRSKACQAELRYALDLKRPLLPVMVRAVSVQLAPAAIADTQIIDYTERTADSAVALVTAAANRTLAPPLPQPLPTPPPPPMSYMNPYREQIQSSDLSFRDQAQVVLALRGHLQDEDERDTARELLVDLRRRQDIAESVARDVDELLASVPAAKTPLTGTTSSWTSPTTTTAEPARAPEPTPSASGAAAPAWYPDPTQRHEQRYWDGSRWTEHVSTPRPTDRGRARRLSGRQLEDGPRSAAELQPPRKRPAEWRRVEWRRVQRRRLPRAHHRHRAVRHHRGDRRRDQSEAPRPSQPGPGSALGGDRLDDRGVPARQLRPIARHRTDRAPPTRWCPPGPPMLHTEDADVAGRPGRADRDLDGADRVHRVRPCVGSPTARAVPFDAPPRRVRARQDR